MIPLRDLNQSATTPHVNRFLLVVNIIFFLVFWLSTMNVLFDERLAIDMVGNGTVRGKFVMYADDILQGRRLYTLFSSMFMHASWYHLMGNMIFLYVFGDNVEDAFGHLSYLFFYLVCGVSASFAQISADLAMSLGVQGMLGASGAISGILGAYLVLYPRARVLTWIFYVVLPVPALLFLGAWFALQWLYGLFDVAGGVAYFAHIGGFIAGMVLGLTVGRERKKTRDKRLRL
ncbi:MAG: rhomboid family intramembrane serine protease [Candidatus Bathyarchaeia archaeon]